MSYASTTHRAPTCAGQQPARLQGLQRWQQRPAVAAAAAVGIGDENPVERDGFSGGGGAGGGHSRLQLRDEGAAQPSQFSADVDAGDARLPTLLHPAPPAPSPHPPGTMQWNKLRLFREVEGDKSGLHE